MSRDAIVLLWLGDEARLVGSDGRPGRTHPIPEEPAGGLVALLAEEYPGAQAVRILYQPAALEIEVLAPGEPAARPPALRRRGGVWSVEPGPEGTQEGVRALEVSSPLPAVARAFEDQGVRVEGAWTLLSLLESAPRSPGEGPAFLRLVVAGSWALLSGADALGRRRMRLHPRQAAEELLAELKGALATFDEHRQAPAWAAIEDGEWPPECLQTVRGLIPAEIPLATLFAGAGRLPAGKPSDFLRPAHRALHVRRPFALAGLAAVGLASALAAWRIHEGAADRRRQQLSAAAANQTARQAQLTSSRRLEEINRALAAAAPPRYRLDLLLLALSRSTPPEVCLRQFVSQGPDFLVGGKTEDSGAAAGDPLEKFRRDLSAGAAAWEWTGTPPPAGRDFLWRGRFRTEPPALARTPAEGAALLARTLGKLPPRGQAERTIALLTRGWSAVPFRAQPADGRLELAFTPPSPRLAEWSDIVAAVQALAAEPGVTLEALELRAGEARDDAFAQARLEIGVRVRGESGDLEGTPAQEN